MPRPSQRDELRDVEGLIGQAPERSEHPWRENDRTGTPDAAQRRPAAAWSWRWRRRVVGLLAPPRDGSPPGRMLVALGIGAAVAALAPWVTDASIVGVSLDGMRLLPPAVFRGLSVAGAPLLGYVVRDMVRELRASRPAPATADVRRTDRRAILVNLINPRTGLLWTFIGALYPCVSRPRWGGARRSRRASTVRDRPAGRLVAGSNGRLLAVAVSAAG